METALTFEPSYSRLKKLTMHWLDWLLVSLLMFAVIWIAIYTRRYMNSVADFLSGGRVAGRYLLAVAKGEMGAGAVSFVATFEVLKNSGFTLNWWNWINIPVTLIVAISGFVIYRYRETRVMTLAQFFEVRYSKAFRIFTGFLGFGAGIVNFGIIPAVGSRFLVYFLGFPATLHLAGFDIPTYIPLMGALLSITLVMTLSGGLITLMVTNCVEGMVSQILYLVLVVGLVAMFSWNEINYALTHMITTTGIVERPPGQSLLNPFDSMGLKDFNIWYVLMAMFVAIYGTMAWQNQSAYNAAAVTAHESRMGGILSRWREMSKGPVVTLLGICAMTYLIHPDFAPRAAMVHMELANISQPQIQQQMEIPVAVSQMLPTGLKGALCVVLLMGVFGGDGTHLHSWGSLFVQDVLVPLRKKPFTPREHIKLLRYSIAGVAFFAFLFGSLFQQTEYIVMWWQVTMGLFVGGAGAAIIGGLYWKKGTTAGAWAALIAGSGLSTGGILARQFSDHFPLNGMQISFFATVIAVVLYLVVSLMTCKQDYNMDRMLHRGEYARHGEANNGKERTIPASKMTWRTVIGIDSNFSSTDQWITIGLFVWTMIWFVVFIIGSVWNLIAPWPSSVWSTFWYWVAIGIPIFWAVVGTLWFTWGGFRDMRLLFKYLRQEKRNALDNGMVVDHQNFDEAMDIPPTGEQSVSKSNSTGS
ncbi:MAG: sodium:solute symporter [Chthoniobacteraceae bacterium]